MKLTKSLLIAIIAGGHGSLAHLSAPDSEVAAETAAAMQSLKLRNEIQDVEKVAFHELRGHPKILKEEETLLRNAAQLVAKGGLAAVRAAESSKQAEAAEEREAAAEGTAQAAAAKATRDAVKAQAMEKAVAAEEEHLAQEREITELGAKKAALAKANHAEQAKELEELGEKKDQDAMAAFQHLAERVTHARKEDKVEHAKKESIVEHIDKDLDAFKHLAEKIELIKEKKKGERIERALASKKASEHHHQRHEHRLHHERQKHHEQQKQHEQHEHYAASHVAHAAHSAHAAHAAHAADVVHAAHHAEAIRHQGHAKGAAEASQLLSGFAKGEESLVREGLREIDEVGAIKMEVIEAIGEQDPRTAARVEKMMNKVRAEQAKLVQEEDIVSREAERLAWEERRGAKTKTAVAATGAEAKAAEAEVEKPVEKPAAKPASDKARKSGAHSQALHQHHQSVVSRGHSIASTNTKSTAETSTKLGARLSKFALDESKLANEDRREFQEMKHVAGKARKAIEGLHLHDGGKTENTVERLLNMAEQDQQKVAMEEHRDAQQDSKLASSMMRGQQGKREQGEHRAALVEQHETAVSSEGTSLFNRFTRQAHRLRVRTSQEEKLARQSYRVFNEAGRARAQVRKDLGGTLVGAEVSELLREAQGATLAAERHQRLEASVTKHEIQSMVKLEQRLRGASK